MIKATIQNSSVAFSAERIMRVQEITFPCSETELSKKLGEIGINLEHLAPMVTVLEIEPSELSVLTDCDVSLDALNYLGKRLDGIDKLERKQFPAVLSCDEADIGYGLKNIINARHLRIFKQVAIPDFDHYERIRFVQIRAQNRETAFYVNDYGFIAFERFMKSRSEQLRQKQLQEEKQKSNAAKKRSR